MPVISVPSCMEVEEGDTFDIEVRVSNVIDLNAWEVYFAYDRDLLEVTGRSVRLFLDEAPNSNVFDFSDSVPNYTGFYRLGAADLSTETGTAEDGDGILARITLHARENGVSWAEIYRADINGDNTIDFGPTLTGERGAHIADTNGDGIFDGTIRSGQIAIDSPCQAPPPTAPPQQGFIVQPTVSVGAGTDAPAPPGGGSPASTGGPSTPGQTTAATDSPADSPVSRTDGGSPGGNGGGNTGGGGSGGWLLYAVIIAGATAGLIGAGWAIASFRRAT